MKYLAALAYYGVRNESYLLQQDVDWCDAFPMAAQEKSRQAKSRRQEEHRQETGAWVYTSRLGMVRADGQPILNSVENLLSMPSLQAKVAHLFRVYFCWRATRQKDLSELIETMREEVAEHQ